MFGHIKGSFTGAIADRIGRFEAADRGTLFLDEIGDLSLTLQAKLLRVLETKEFERVGSSKTIRTSARIVAATNRDLKKDIESGKFRQDLYFRLNTVNIKLPPLRARKDDIPILIKHFVDKFNRKYNRLIKTVSHEALTLLYDHNWPGNIRELEHTIEFAFIHCHEDTIKPAHLPKEIYIHDKELLRKDTSLPASVQGEKERIISVLQEVKWNRTDAAKKLNISRATLWRKIKEYGIE